MNELFDTLKENVENNQNIILAVKSDEQDLAIYNLTSDSDDSEDFKKKKIEVKKHISMKLTGNEFPTRQTKLTNRRNRIEKTPDKVIKKPFKQNKKSSRRKRLKQCKPYNLADERMREALLEKLNTSFILEKSAKVDKEPKLIMETVPQMEVITDEDYGKLQKYQKIIRSKKNKARFNPLLKKTKTQKSESPNEKIDIDDRTISPLPELVVEYVKVNRKDLNDSLSSQTIMKKFKEAYKSDLDEPSKTQNLLDIDSVECNSHVINISNKINVICPVEINNNMSTVKSKHKDAKPKQNTKIVKEDVIETYTVTKIVHNESQTRKINYHSNTINISNNIGGKSEKSINTVVKSVITAHGDMNEAPPDFELLNETVKPKNVDFENIDLSLKDYFLKRRGNINALPVSSRKMNIKMKQSPVLLEKIDTKKKKDSISIKSPTVSIPILSCEDIRQGLSSRKNSESESSSSKKDYEPKTLKVSQLHRTSNTNETTVKINEGCKEFEKSKSSTHSCSSSKDTTTKTSNKEIYKLNKFKYNRNNNSESKAEDTNTSYSLLAVLQKHDTSNINEEEPELASRIIRARNLDSNTDLVNNKKDDPFVSTTNTVLRQSSDSSTISTIKFNDIESVNISHNNEKYEKNTETTNNSKIINSNRKWKNNKTKTDTVLRQINDAYNSVRSSLRFDDIEPIIPLIEEDVKNSVTSNNPTKNKIVNSNEKGKSFKIKTHTVMRPANNDKSAISSKRVDEKEILNKQNNAETIVKTLEISNNLKVDLSKLSARNDNNKILVKNVLKRKSERPLSVFVKRRKPEEVLSGNGHSVSRVNDWFKRNAPLSSAESISQSYTDTLQNVMEKLDTTVAEIHQNTSKKFINLFVNVQQQLDELRTKKLNMFKQATAEMTAIFEAKYADLETRSKQLDSEFTELLKNLSSEIIKEDFTQKCATILLLKEDLQATADYLVKKM